MVLPSRVSMPGPAPLVLGVLFCLAAGCNSQGTTPPNPSKPTPTPTSSPTTSPTSTPTYAQVYAFKGGTDGSTPFGGVTAVDGVLYGATQSGGSTFFGVVFSLKPGASTDTVLHTFGTASDGKNSFATLVASGGTLYGTTAYGGTHVRGTVFSIRTNGASYRVLYNFGATNTDAQVPFEGVIAVGSALYGTTSGGGTYNAGAGTVFSIGTNGANYTVMHSFGKGHDGFEPLAGLTAANGVLYGTTAYGGRHPCLVYVGCGTVFAIDYAGNERIVHSFGLGTDGRTPQAPVIDVNGTLYGTTFFGGTEGSCHNGHHAPERCGTVFSVSPTGTQYAVLRNFGDRSGSEPTAALLYYNGTLFGTTYNGGRYGRGTAFSIDPDGSNYHLLYSFGATSTDGQYPASPLIVSNGVIYGTTTAGGTGNGTIFSLTPQP